ncbi:MAG: YceI family protein [Acidobacteria bacterium]|nr:YceI family protein [Acidobacteriota bacterium]MBI3656485.1 YceI family protein [Acidobacteriota bacterium]
MLLLTITALLNGFSWAAEYTIDPDHSQVIFKVKHLGISTVTGRFEKLSGAFEFDPQNPAGAKARASIETASINTAIAKRDTHLRSADFFEAGKFPAITFMSKAIKSTKDGKFIMSGDLTMHGVTRSVELQVELGGVIKDPWGNQRAAFTGSTTINRKDFGLTWNKAMETGGLVVGEEVKISLEVEGVQKPSAKARP